MFTADRDLLAVEPDLFRDLGYLAQRLLSTTATLNAGKLTTASSQLGALGIGAGSVVLFGGVPLEVVERLSDTELTVSLLRARRTSPILPPPAAGSTPAVVFTFAPQIAAAHDAVLAMFGVARAGLAAPGEPDETRIVNPDDLRGLETALAMQLVYAAAGALAGPGSAQAARAAQYHRVASSIRAIARARLDLNGDGVADAERRAAAAMVTRG